MMLGLQGSTTSPKVYRCVACSATFSGLSSLLVHQASHASTQNKVSSVAQQPSLSSHEGLFTSTQSPAEPTVLPAVHPVTSQTSFYICDCGEEFQNFSQMLEHKRSHIAEVQLSQPKDSNIVTQHVSLNQTVTQLDVVHDRPSTSKSPISSELPALKDSLLADISSGGKVAKVEQGLSTPQGGDGTKTVNSAPTVETISETEKCVENEQTPVSHSNNNDSLPSNKSIMKLLASAYRHRFSSAHPPNHNDNKPSVPLKEEVVPVDVTPIANPIPKADVLPGNELSVAQLKKLLSQPGGKTKAPSISKVIELSKKRVVSLTMTLSPVVVLETRNKLRDPVGNALYGIYQCGRCRRVFQNLDKLTEHHFLHKKERIKCCRHCKQLIIGRVPLPDNHTCPQMKSRNSPSPHYQSRQSSAQKVKQLQGNPKKVYFCPLCKHTYARRWNLKKHKCVGSAPSQQTEAPIQNRLLLKSSSNGVTEMQENPESLLVKSVSVGTGMGNHIKVEGASPDSQQSSGSQQAWNPPAEHFPLFYPKSSVVGQNNDASLIPSPQEQEMHWNEAAAHDDDSNNDYDDNDGNEGQWTIPLDHDMVGFNAAGKGDAEKEINKSGPVVDEDSSNNLQYVIRDGVKWYPCSRCNKTYSQACTLRRHLRLCAFRPRVPGTASSQLTADGLRLFACFFCGRNFNRKDNMMSHSKRCQHRSASDIKKGSIQQNLSASATDSQTPQDDESNWGIMSLPSVLPRRVTCECGVGFTSPKLLLEHLQKHAQESYTCPTCGETVSSWADYEVHLQIHMHPHNQLLKGLQPSQPLLLRFQQQPVQPQQTPAAPPVCQPSHEQPRLLHLPKKKPRIVCTRCGNTFSSRCSLWRHVSWNRCKGAQVSNSAANPPKTYHCSNCNSDFPNSISLTFHQRSGTCKPAVKPVRCPSCFRWFNTVVGLQRHLLTHKRSEYRCDICQGTYANLKSLKTHRRKIHHIMATNVIQQTKEN
ncbi:zinc finger protein 836 [Cynoglossus semilaevis]|uniref:zinc finger protein 836 n=1 Tax=Cynoglossus semilaevis TaxID=244447 RepID=UPI000495D121|nr:zinc finger protein 836-like [Cynoglossus semilaevis]XP_024917026.1 zinc finger protein 836-like [Cynoglossus semilaevis]